MSTADKITYIASQLNVPRGLISGALDNDTIISVGYAGQIVIDAADVLAVVAMYNLTLKEITK